MVYDEKIIRKSRRRAWMTVITGFTIFFFIYGVAYNCLGLFMTPMAETYAAHRATISSLYTVMTILELPVGLLIAPYIDKHDIKIPMAIGCICAGFGFMLYGLATQLWMLYAAACLEGIGLCLTIQGPVAISINYWFIERRGMAMGITMVGSGVGGTILSQVLSKIILANGWQTAYIVAGVLCIVFCLPLILAFTRKDPNAYGMYKYGEEKQHETEELAKLAAVEEAREKNSKISNFIKTPEFWFLFLGLALIALPGMGIKSHMVAYMTDLGYAPETAANILSLSVFAVIPGKIIIGWLYDKIGSIKACVVAGICMTFGIAFILGAPVAVLFLVAFGAVYGFGSVFTSIGPPLVIATVLKTNKNFATVMAFSSIGMGLCSAFGTLIVGAMFDATGSYTLAFTIASFVLAAGFAIVITALYRARKKHQEIESKADDSTK